MQRICTNSSGSARGLKSLHGTVPLPPEVTCTSPSPHTRIIIYAPCSEKYVETMAIWLTKIYNLISRVPKWIFLVASGSIGSLLIQAMHSRGQKKEKASKRVGVKSAKAVPPPPAASVPVASAPVATEPGSTTTSASPAKTRSEGSPSGGRRRKNARR